MAALLLVGSAPYPIDDRGTAFLVEWIRDLCVREDGKPLGDEAAAACLRLADEIEASTANDPIELGDTAIEGLCAYVMRDYLVRGHDEMTALYFALRRYRGDPLF
jgi:hypothetical protein